MRVGRVRQLDYSGGGMLECDQGLVRFQRDVRRKLFIDQVVRFEFCLSSGVAQVINLQDTQKFTSALEDDLARQRSDAALAADGRERELHSCAGGQEETSQKKDVPRNQIKLSGASAIREKPVSDLHSSSQAQPEKICRGHVLENQIVPETIRTNVGHSALVVHYSSQAQAETSKLLNGSISGSSLQRKFCRFFANQTIKWSNRSRVEVETRMRKFDSVLLEALSAEAGPEPIALRRLLWKVVAALAPPRLLSQESSGVAMNACAAKHLQQCAAFQKDIRRILLQALRIWKQRWDDEQIEPVLALIRKHISDFTSRGLQISQARAAKAWHRLWLVVAPQAIEDDIASKPPALAKALSITRRVSVITRAKLQHRSRITDSYEPGLRVKNFPTILHRPLKPKLLECEECSYKISSCWYFRHPKTGSLAVLVPNNGHAPCRRRYKRNSNFQVLDGSAFKRDSPNNIDYCEHQILRHVCAPCGGLSSCDHGKPRWNCSICRQSITKRARTKAIMGEVYEKPRCKELISMRRLDL